MNNPIEIAKARLASLKEETEKLQLFISAYESVADLLTPSPKWSDADLFSGEKAVDEAETAPSVRTRAVNPPTQVIVKEAIRILEEHGHPMSRRALHEQLWRRNVQVRGTDPVKTLGTILWRATNDVIQLEGYGYWPKAIPYARAKYIPPVVGPDPFKENEGAFD